ncbi:MAG: nucleotidyltransferase domain-containing protein [Candidatus Peribacteraceae bacterium]
MNIELSQRISELVKQLVDKFRPEKIILFGSAARGDMSPDSDLDILIVKKDVPQRGIDRQLEVDRLIKRNGIALDILVYKPEELEAALQLGDPFIKEILTKGRALYG